MDNLSIDSERVSCESLGSPEYGVFNTGAIRSKDVDEERYDLISPIALEGLARAYAEGARNYPIYNCEKGFGIYDLVNHAIKHWLRYASGDRTEDHLSKAMWGFAMAKHSEVKWPELNKGTLRKEGEYCVPPDNEKGLYWKDLKK